MIQYATARVGAILVNVNPSYRQHELDFVLRPVGPVAAAVRAGLQGRRLPAAGRGGRRPGPARVDRAGRRRTGTRSWRGADGVDPTRWTAREAGLTFDQPINIQYTSGTTGFPKGATLSHHNILNNGLNVGEMCGYDETDRICVPVPFYHCFGMVMGNLAAVTHGSCIVIPSEAFDARAVLEAVQRRAVHVAVRRADDVHRRAGRPGAGAVRRVVAAHRASWPARRARSRSCGARAASSTWTR